MVRPSLFEPSTHNDNMLRIYEDCEYKNTFSRKMDRKNNRRYSGDDVKNGRKILARISYPRVLLDLRPA